MSDVESSLQECLDEAKQGDDQHTKIAQKILGGNALGIAHAFFGLGVRGGERCPPYGLCVGRTASAMAMCGWGDSVRHGARSAILRHSFRRRRKASAR